MSARPEIFISATSRDLRSCRQVVRDALLTLGCVPVVQEHFDLDARTVREMLRTRIAACDGLIHLAGECYGAEPHKHEAGAPRRSYTQLEYDLARELKKPVYTFICAEQFRYDAHYPEPADLRALQDNHRADLQLRDELYQFIRVPQELALRVRELQTCVEFLTKDLQRTRSWLGLGVAAVLLTLTLIGIVLFGLQQRARRTKENVTLVSGEVERCRQSIWKVAEQYGKDIAPIRKLTGDARFERALTFVATEQQTGVEELRTRLDGFAAQVSANPKPDLYDRALANFAEKRFAAAAADAIRSAGLYRAQREAAAAVALPRPPNGQADEFRERERRSWSLAGDAELAAEHYPDALEPFQRALALTDENKDPLRWLDSTQNLGAVLWQMDRRADAESLARTLAENRAAIQGSDHPDTLTSVNNLANVAAAKGDAATAESLYRQTLQARERTLSAEHPATLDSVDGLAAAVDSNNDQTTAEPLYRRALAARERTLGKEHPDTLASMGNLAFLLYSKGDLAGAETLYRSALKVQERRLGKDHADTLLSLSNLAAMLYDQGDLAAAEPLFRRVLEARTRTLGAENAATLQSASALAFLLYNKGDLLGAKALFCRMLKAREHRLGKTHPETLANVRDLARLLDAKGEFAAAEPLYLHAQAGMQQVLPPEDADYLELEYDFSLLRAKQGRLNEALSLAEIAATGVCQTLPKNSPVRLRYEKHLQNLRARLAGETANGGR